MQSKFKVIWQAKFHDKPQEEFLNSLEEAENSVMELLDNGRKINVQWVITPELKEVYDD